MKKLGIALTLLLLAACHHDNPLRTQPKKTVASFLMNASANVEKRLHFDIQKDSHGFGYLECMDGKKSPEVRCDALIAGMVNFAKENHYPAFKYLTLSQLTDKTVFEGLADDYAELAVTTWPHYFPEHAS